VEFGSLLVQKPQQPTPKSFISSLLTSSYWPQFGYKLLMSVTSFAPRRGADTPTPV